MKDETVIPPFVQEYLDKMDYEGYGDFAKLSREYQKEKEEFPGKFSVQSANLQQHNRVTGQNNKLDYKTELGRLETRYQQRASEIAKEHGYEKPIQDQQKTSGIDFDKQEAKFQDMINDAKERKNQPEKEKQQEASAKEPLDREQLRADFLEKMKQTREQISQRQQDQGQERQ